MKCPVCNVDMVVVEHKKIELDYCVKCSGVWFDSGELELLLDRVETEAGTPPGVDLKPHETESAEKRRRCPLCRQRMKKALIGEKPAMLVDTCPRGEGLWFDGGELEQVIRHAAQKPMGTLSTHSVLA